MKFTLKPVYIGWSTFVAQLQLQLFFTIWTGGFFGGLYEGFVSKLVPLPVSPYILIGTLAFILFPIGICTVKKLNYQKTEYKFFEDRLEFEEGFLTINKKSIKFQDIKEVTLRRGILQQANGLGTIYLATLATGSAVRTNPFSGIGLSSTSASGISVMDVSEPEQAYEKIRALIASQKTDKA